MAAIVYEGVGGGGELFGGLKFFILQRVPFRDTWKELIEANGGEVIKIDKHADYVIADRIRKDCPPGSISWQWVQESAKQGRLLDIEKYRAGPVEGSTRPVGSRQPTKSTRTPFSADDDRVLMDWVTRAERRGVSILGNELYKQLEQKNPRHTFQSWRDRWVKQLSHRPRPPLPDDDEDENPDEVPAYIPVRRTAPRSSATVPARNRTSRPSSSKPRAREVSESTDNSRTADRVPYREKSKGGNHFTDEDVAELMNEYEHIKNLDEEQSIDAWIAFAVLWPNHTAQEWRNYYTKVLVPKVEAGLLNGEEGDNIAAQEEETSVLPPIVQRSSKPQAKPEASNERPSTVLEVKDSQGSSGKTLSSQSPRNQNVDPTLVDEKVFEARMRGLAEKFKLDIELNFAPEICGRIVPLFRLWQVVMSDKFGGKDEVNGRRRWPQVAKELNFNEFKHSGAAQLLQELYDDLLADFEEVRNDWVKENLDLTDSQEADTSQLIADQLFQTDSGDMQGHQMNHIVEDDEDKDDDLDQPPSSIPQHYSTPSGKRSFDADASYEDEESSFKRPKIDKGKGKEPEIPGTPEEILNGKQAARPLNGPSPLKNSINVIDLAGDSDESDGLFVKDTYQASPSRPAPRHLEPETQDFRFTATQPLEPEDGDPEDGNNSWVEISSSSLAPTKSAPAEESTQSQTESEDIDAYIDHCIALGYNAEIVAEALDATTMETAYAKFVMEALMNEEGIPQDIPGVWTSQDDAALDASENSREFRRVVKKHGRNRIKTRRNYIKDREETEASGS